MYYQLLPELKPITLEEVDENALTAGYIEFDELQSAIERFGFTDVEAADCLADRDNYRNSVDAFETYTFGLVNIVNVTDVYAVSDRLALFFRKNLLLVASLRDLDGSTRESFMTALRRYKPESVTLEKLIFAMLESSIARDAQGLARFEKEVDMLEERVALGTAEKDLSATLYQLKKQLLFLRGYYDQLIDIGEALEENENDIFETDALHYFGLLTNKANRLCDEVNRLCDELNQLRDAHIASMDYHLNNIMEFFTLITVVFMPLTLMVGWYGMNFANMPELIAKWGYPVFIVACLVVTAGILIWFKKKKWF